MKRTVLCIFLFTLFLARCSGTLPEHYEFRNIDQEIKSVELFYNHWALNKEYNGPIFESIRALDETEIPLFMKEVRSLETHKQHSPPMTDYGEYVAIATYENGDVEVFGNWHIEYVEKDAEFKFLGIYAFDEDFFDELFFKYAGRRDFSEYKNKESDDSTTPYEGPLPPQWYG